MRPPPPMVEPPRAQPGLVRQPLSRLGRLLVCLSVFSLLLERRAAVRAFVVVSSSSGPRSSSSGGTMARLHASTSAGGGAGEEEVAVVMEAARADTLLPGALATYGRLFSNANSSPVKFVAPNEDVGIHMVAGESGDGEPVVAFVSPQAMAKATKGSTLRVPRSAVVGRPASVGADDASLLSYYGLSLLPQLMKAGIQDKAATSAGGAPGEKKVVIVTGAGPDAHFAIQILRAWECDVIACSRRQKEQLMKAGAVGFVDSSKSSFSELYPSYAAVVDTVGTDVESIAQNLREMKNAIYVSTMPSSTRRMQQKGLLSGASIFGSVFAGKPEVAPSNAFWIPERAGLELVSYALEIGPSLDLSFLQRAPDMQDYMDAILWPKDAELNCRFGFPAPPPEEGAGEGWRPAGNGSGQGALGGDDAALLREYTQRRGGGQDGQEPTGGS